MLGVVRYSDVEVGMASDTVPRSLKFLGAIQKTLSSNNEDDRLSPTVLYGSRPTQEHKHRRRKD